MAATKKTTKKKNGSKSTKTVAVKSPKKDDLVSILANSLNIANKDIGKIAFVPGKDEDDPSTVTDWVSTGSDLLDLAISNRPHGGVPAGRITEITGLESTGKTLLGAAIIAETQKRNGFGVLIDTETSID